MRQNPGFASKKTEKYEKTGRTTDAWRAYFWLSGKNGVKAARAEKS
jgi:hypothetical protein